MSCSSDERSDDFTLAVEDDALPEINSENEGSEDEVETFSDSESGERLSAGGFCKSDQPSPLEWIQFNEKVISMRPLFKSAKVQFANKLTRQIKMLRNRKGDKDQVEKCQRKADRLVEEISYVNRLKQDIVAKFALLHSKEEITKIINDPSSSMEYRVKAKVAMMPKISKAADQYHQSHPDWRESLIKLIQLAGSKMKKKRRKMRGKGKKARKKKTPEERQNEKKPAVRIQAEDDGTGRFDASNFPEPPPGLEASVANTDSSDEGNSGDENEWNPPKVRVGSSSNEESSSEEEDLSLWKKLSGVQENRKNGTMLKNPKEPIKKRGESDEMFRQKLQEPESGLKEPMKRKQNVVRNQNLVNKNYEPKKMTKPLENEPENLDQHSDDDTEELERSSKSLRCSVDPFFMTSDNKEYKTLWKVEPADSFKNKDKEKEKDPVFVFKNARTYQEVISGKPAKRPIAIVSNKKDRKRKGKHEQGPLDPAKLHPSWQAKKKLNLTAAPFQGKKIVFDDD